MFRRELENKLDFFIKCLFVEVVAKNCSSVLDIASGSIDVFDIDAAIVLLPVPPFSCPGWFLGVFFSCDLVICA